MWLSRKGLVGYDTQISPPTVIAPLIYQRPKSGHGRSLVAQLGLKSPKV